MTTSHADLPVVVDRAGTVPLAAQISAQVRVAVAAGVLPIAVTFGEPVPDPLLREEIPLPAHIRDRLST